MSNLVVDKHFTIFCIKKELEKAIIQLEKKCEQIQQDMDQEVQEVGILSDDKTISQLFNNKLESPGKENDIWNQANNYLVGRYALEFIKQKCPTITQDQQKLKLWILLEVSQKTLENLFDHISQTNFILLYKKESVLRDKLERILELCSTLQRINYKINGRMPQMFEQYCSEQDIKDSSYQTIRKQATKKSPNNNANTQQQSQKPEPVINYNTNNTADNIQKQNMSYADTNQVTENSKLKVEMPSKMVNQSPISKPVEEPTEEDKTDKNQNNQNNTIGINMQTLLNMHNTNNGRSSTALFVPGGGGMRATIGFNDQPGYQNHEDENQNKHKIKPSQNLFKTRFSTIVEKFSDKYKEANTLANQQYQCFECGAKISKGLYIIGNNAYFCHYTGKFYCYDCIAIDKKPIPWKAVESFDLTSYKVCKKAEKEINALYNKPIIQFEYESEVVKSNQTLYDFMILKRQIYLLYDFLCNPKYLEDTMGNCLNLLIKPNIFSLKNFYDINNGSLTKQIENNYKLFQTHIEGCDKCPKRGKDCTFCNKPPKLYLFDIKNTFLCKCDKLYHRQCAQWNECEDCRHDG